MTAAGTPDRDRLRELIHDALSPAARRTLHRRAAEALDVGPEPPPPEVRAALVQHWDLAGEGDRSLHHLEHHADYLLRAGAYHDAIAALTAALQRADARDARDARDTRDAQDAPRARDGASRCGVASGRCGTSRRATGRGASPTNTGWSTSRSRTRC